jgi:signal transduction histidine kinase
MRAPRTITSRIALLSAGFTLVTLALLVAYFWWRLVRNLDHQMDRYVDEEFEEMQEALAKGDGELGEDFQHDERAHAKLGCSSQLRDAAGRTILKAAWLEEHELPWNDDLRRELEDGRPHTRLVEVDGEATRVRSRLLRFPDGRARVLQVGLSEHESRDAQRAFLRQAGYVAAPFVLLALLGGWIAARRALRPLEHMADAASRIRAESLSERLPLAGTGDEVDRLGESLNATLAQLEESFRKIRDFSASASHQLKTPLTVIRGEADLLLRELADTPQGPRLVTISDEAARLSRTVDQLLFLARADAEAVEIQREAVPLAPLVEAALRRVEPYVTVKRLRVESRVEAGACARGSESLLGTAVQNVMDNAARLSPEGGRIIVRGTAADGRVRLDVEDDGPGIPPAERPVVMERFHRAGRNGPGGGTGLGLAVAREIAALHGGSLAVLDVEEGRGAHFRLEVPRAEPERLESPEGPAARGAGVPASTPTASCSSANVGQPMDGRRP